MKKRIISLLLVLALACSLLVLPANAAEVAASGTCGEDLMWEITSDGTAVISGTGVIDSDLRSSWPEDVTVTSLVVKSGVSEIGNYAFSGLNSLERVTIEEGLSRIGHSAFENCSSLKYAEIGDGPEYFGESIFNNCASLERIVLPDTLKHISWAMFQQCENLKHVNIPDNVTGIVDFAFNGCKSLEEVPLPDSVTSIGPYAFSFCTSLKSITIPDGVTEIRSETFWHCESLVKVTIPDSVTSIQGGAFSACISLPEISIPASVSSMDGNTFENCRNLKSITIPEGVPTIGRYAFWSCESLANVTIPVSVTRIGEQAFRECSSLADVYYQGSAEQWDAIAISDDENDPLLNATIHFGPTEPAFTTQPADYTGKVNSTASFSVSAEGDGLTYQWQVSDDGGETWTNSSVKNPKYSTKLTTAKDGRMVRCIVSDKYGNSVTSDAAVMKLQKELRITTQPKDYTGKEGATAKFTVKAVGDGLTYQWQISDNGGKTWSNSSVKAASYSTKLTAAKDGRMVRCMVTDQYGSFAISDAATMQIKKAISITTQPKDYTGKVNSTAKFTVAAEGNGLTYQWQISDDDGVTWVNSSVKAASYSTKLTAAKNGRMVRCVVTDAVGNSVTSSEVQMIIG